MFSFLNKLMSGRRSVSTRSRTCRPVRNVAQPRRLEVEGLEERMVLSPIWDKYWSLGGPNGFLGQPTTGEYDTFRHDGRWQSFQGGTIYWSSNTGAHEVHGAILGEYTQLGWEMSFLGFPTTDETTTWEGHGRYNGFQGGLIEWSPASGAHEVHGAILAEFASLGWEHGVLGYPTSDETDTARHDGRYNNFQYGNIYWSPATGAHEVHGAIWSEYTHLNWELGFLGFPTSDETATAKDGSYNSFQGGFILSSPASGAHEVHGAILSKYAAMGWQNSPLGFPVTDETGTPDGDGRYNHFQYGAIDWTPSTGAHEVHGAIAAQFASLGWESAGEVVTDEIDLSQTGGAYNRFQEMVNLDWRGYAIDWTPQNGASVVPGTSYTDIRQGSEGTCWINAAMAAVENSGWDLSQRIQYQGNNWYTVSLYNRNDFSNPWTGGFHAETQWVYFDGTRNDADPQWDPLRPSQSWTIIIQRAILEAVMEWDPSQSLTTPHSGGSADSLSILTGTFATGNQLISAQDANVQQRIYAALANGENVTLGTSPNTQNLVASHFYAVLSANDQGVRLYNPWGSAITVPWSEITQDGSVFVMS